VVEEEGEFKKQAKTVSWIHASCYKNPNPMMKNQQWVPLKTIEDAKKEIFDELQRIANDGCYLPQLATILKKWLGDGEQKPKNTTTKTEL
jgi:hypothetical protein